MLMNKGMAQVELVKALDEFHKNNVLVKATKENPFHKNMYADFNTVVSMTRGDLAKAGLRVKQAISHIDGQTAIWTCLVHLDSGEYIESISPVAHKESDPQSQGSGITYMKRYSYIAILDLLVDKDDDGNLTEQLKKTAEHDKKVGFAIEKIEKVKSSDELRELWKDLGKLINDKRVRDAKDKKKMEFTDA